MPKDLGGVIAQLQQAGMDGWLIVTFALGALVVWKGPAYIKVVLTFLNERHRIDGNLSLKRERFQHEIDQKRGKINSRKEKTVKVEGRGEARKEQRS